MVKLKESKQYQNIGRVYSKDGNTVLGLYGRVGNLLDNCIVNVDTDIDNWVFIPYDTKETGTCTPFDSKAALAGFLNEFFYDRKE